MTFTTFLLTVLAVAIGNKTTLNIFTGVDDAEKIRFSIFHYGFVVVDSTINSLWNPKYVEGDAVPVGLIKQVIARKEWHLRFGKYYVFYTTP
jgi:hypothetical protein